MIPPKAAITLGVDPAKAQKRIEVVTASGVEYLPVVTLPKVECLGITLPHVEVAVPIFPASSPIIFRTPPPPVQIKPVYFFVAPAWLNGRATAL